MYLPIDFASFRISARIGDGLCNEVVQVDHRVVRLGAADSGKFQQVMREKARLFIKPFRDSRRHVRLPCRSLAAQKHR